MHKASYEPALASERRTRTRTRVHTVRGPRGTGYGIAAAVSLRHVVIVNVTFQMLCNRGSKTGIGSGPDRALPPRVYPERTKRCEV